MWDRSRYEKGRDWRLILDRYRRIIVLWKIYRRNLPRHRDFALSGKSYHHDRIDDKNFQGRLPILAFNQSSATTFASSFDEFSRARVHSTGRCTFRIFYNSTYNNLVSIIHVEYNSKEFYGTLSNRVLVEKHISTK